MDAFKLLGKASYKYSGFDEKLLYIQHMYVSKKVEKIAGYAAPFITLAMEHKVKFTWSFQ